ncbi:DUF2785 domain-containing protein [Paenibacillus sp. AR247]|uniref:DUF2785 domain-containing protein n=1 Tax=Paenibacillus sp. AR247 TaxID=1631599 RepID=UPI000CF89A05|nr:DUF2785 domain-containing protein [Paenibacillus sp. AR247]PQP90626.1 hypothetical protein CPT76_06685 [Paenibacillus sp. AR247]
MKRRFEELISISKESMTRELANEMISFMLENIGATDPRLRDELIYGTLARWIHNDFFNEDQLEHILTKATDDNHLFHQIGEVCTDSVFKRSFSALAAAAVLQKDQNDVRLDQDTVSGLLERVCQYLEMEQDTRGYVEGKGWAHAIAHGADLLAAAVRHQLSPVDGSGWRVLNVVGQTLFKGYVYSDDEDERLIQVLIALLHRKDSGEVNLGLWLQGIAHDLVRIHADEGAALYFFRSRTNVMNFFKTLYFYPAGEEYRKNLEGHILMLQNMI